jgi:predicted ribosome quality control (RQC) complex YloA/Tae2 family protein
MPRDAITLHALAQELHAKLKDKRISKIYQSEDSEIVIVMRSGERLAVSANPSMPRIYLTSEKKEGELAARSFQMLLRKHIGGGKIEKIELVNKDRIIKITVASFSELRDIGHFYLYVELMGRYSNIILVNSEQVIMDAVKRVSFDDSALRPILPGVKYAPQMQKKAAPDDIPALARAVAEAEERGELNASGLIGRISGIAKETAKEALFRAKSREDIPFILTGFYNICASPDYAPCVSLDDKGQARDAFICPYLSMGSEFAPVADLNAAFEWVFSAKAALERKERDTKELRRALKRLKDKNDRRITAAKERLKECEKMDEYKRCGEMLIANLHNLNGNRDFAVVYDYAEEKEVTIPLDRSISPQKNADRYFKQYGKLKRARQISTVMLKEGEEFAQYLQSIENAINICSTKQEFSQIAQELAELTAPQKAAKAKQRPAMPEKVVFEGYEIYYGKNNKQNETVTFDIASHNDIWLHAKEYPGAHVIIKGGDIPQSVLEEGARTAARYSGAEGKCEVVWCLKKHVKRIPGGACGQVSYKNFKTILIEKE